MGGRVYIYDVYKPYGLRHYYTESNLRILLQQTRLVRVSHTNVALLQDISYLNGNKKTNRCNPMRAIELKLCWLAADIRDPDQPLI